MENLPGPTPLPEEEGAGVFIPLLPSPGRASRNDVDSQHFWSAAGWAEKLSEDRGSLRWWDGSSLSPRGHTRKELRGDE